MQRLCAHHFTAIVMVLILFGGPVQVFGSVRSAAMAHARRAQQEQMKQQAAEQKAMAEAERKAAAAEAAEEQRKQDAHTRANRLRIEREKQAREAAIAKRKAGNLAKEKAANPGNPAKTTTQPKSKPAN
jgi:hypothetical protein